jgi:hypothetical protein
MTLEWLRKCGFILTLSTMGSRIRKKEPLRGMDTTSTYNRSYVLTYGPEEQWAMYCESL